MVQWSLVTYLSQLIGALAKATDTSTRVTFLQLMAGNQSPSAVLSKYSYAIITL